MDLLQPMGVRVAPGSFGSETRLRPASAWRSQCRRSRVAHDEVSSSFREIRKLSRWAHIKCRRSQHPHVVAPEHERTSSSSSIHAHLAVSSEVDTPQSSPVQAIGTCSSLQQHLLEAWKRAAQQLAHKTWRLPLLLALLVVFSGGSFFFSPRSAFATSSSGQTIASSSAGFKVASWLRSATGGALPDEAIVLLVAALPVVELRGAIPVALWMGMTPLKASFLSILGNMLPVPFILAFLGPLSQSLTSWSTKAKEGLDWVLEYTRKKADPIVEFQALGLMLSVAVPLPGTGAWSGAIAAHVLKLPFWEAFWANFFGVVLAGAIVSALCLLGLREAVALAAGLFLLSGVMWSALRAVLPKGS